MVAIQSGEGWHGAVCRVVSGCLQAAAPRSRTSRDDSNPKPPGPSVGWGEAALETGGGVIIKGLLWPPRSLLPSLLFSAFVIMPYKPQPGLLTAPISAFLHTWKVVWL